jgi:hypothetical protein
LSFVVPIVLWKLERTLILTTWNNQMGVDVAAGIYALVSNGINRLTACEEL